MAGRKKNEPGEAGGDGADESKKAKGKTRVLSRGSESLPCDLTDQEILAKSREQSRVIANLRAHIDFAKQQAKTAAAEKARLEASREALALEIGSGTEARQINIEETADYEAGVVHTVRLDTGKVVRTRPMRIEDRQLEAPGTPPQVRKAGEKVTSIVDGKSGPKLVSATEKPAKTFEGSKIPGEEHICINCSKPKAMHHQNETNCLNQA